MKNQKLVEKCEHILNNCLSLKYGLVFKSTKLLTVIDLLLSVLRFGSSNEFELVAEGGFRMMPLLLFEEEILGVSCLEWKDWGRLRSFL